MQSSKGGVKDVPFHVSRTEVYNMKVIPFCPVELIKG